LGALETRTCRGDPVHGSGIGSIEEIEELQIRLELDALPKIEPFCHADIDIDEARRAKVVAAFVKSRR